MSAAIGNKVSVGIAAEGGHVALFHRGAILTGLVTEPTEQLLTADPLETWIVVTFRD
jgi:hypothetical protein